MKPNLRIKYMWAITSLLIFQFVISITLMLTSILSDDRRESLIIGVLMELSAIVLTFIIEIIADRYYSRYEIEFKKDNLLIKRGLFVQKAKEIPYSEIKNVKVVKSGIYTLEQMFGLVTVSIKAKNNIELIRGLSQPELFIKKLIAHIDKNEVLKNSDLYLNERELILKNTKLNEEIVDKLTNLKEEIDKMKTNIISTINSHHNTNLMLKPKENKELINIVEKKNRKRVKK